MALSAASAAFTLESSNCLRKVVASLGRHSDAKVPNIAPTRKLSQKEGIEDVRNVHEEINMLCWFALLKKL